MNRLPPLKPHQLSGLGKIRQARREGRVPLLVVAPPGAGKSRAMLELAIDEARRGGRTVIKVHRKMLLDQLVGNFAAAGITPGVISPDYTPEPEHKIQIVSAQTVYSRAVLRSTLDMPEAQLVITDEAHQQSGTRERAIIFGSFQNNTVQVGYANNGADVIGFTATPLMNGRIYKHIIELASYSELRACGMHQLIATVGPTEIDTQGLNLNRAMEYSEKKLEERVQIIFGDVYSHWQVLNPMQLPTILFAPSVPSSRWFANQFFQRGVPVAHLDGTHCLIPDGGELKEYKSTREHRQQILDMSKSGEIKCIMNRFVLREAVDCLDSETEVLTEAGWRGVNDHWHSETKVWTLNKNTLNAELLPINGMFSRQRRPGERMVTFKSQHSDIRVTEGHRIHFKYFDPSIKDAHGTTGRFSKNWVVKPAREMVGRGDFVMPVSAKKDSYQGVEFSDSWIELLGWWVTDGSTSMAASKPQIFIHQKKQRWIPAIRAMLDEIGVRYKVWKNKKNVFTFSIRGADVWPVLGDFLNKQGTPAWDRFDRRQFYVLWKAMCRGDGSVAARRPGEAVTFNNLTCGRKELADYLMHLGVLRGARMSCSERVSNLSGKKYWAVYMKGSAPFMASRPTSEKSMDVEFESGWIAETVWCVNNDNDTLITRRRGKVAIIGNCPWLYHGITATVFGSVTTALQVVGRLQRKWPAYTHKILQDHGGIYWRHGDPNEDREWKLGDTAKQYSLDRVKKIQSGELPEGIRCPKCGTWRKEGEQCYGCNNKHKQSVRVVRQITGNLKRMTGKIYKASKTGDDRAKLWTSALFAGGRANRSVATAVKLYADQLAAKGMSIDWSVVSNKPPSPDSTDWHRSVRSVYPWTMRRKVKS